MRRDERQFQGEGGPPAQTVTLSLQSASQLFGRERAAVQSKAVAVPACREALVEDRDQVLGWDADPVVLH